MYQERYLRGNTRDSFQAYTRMRIPPILLPHVRQVHVIHAIRANAEIDTDNLFARALDDVTHGQNASVFAGVATFMEKMVTGKLRGSEFAEAIAILSGLHKIDLNDESYPNVRLFNRRFLNDRGLIALVTLLVTDAAELDTAAIDRFRGGETLSAAYGQRRTRQQKVVGKNTQELLKLFAPLDEPAMKEAAERYVSYRFLHNGDLADYMKREQLEGNRRSERYLRQWFQKFDDAFGYPRPPRGRPRRRRRRRT